MVAGYEPEGDMVEAKYPGASNYGKDVNQKQKFPNFEEHMVVT